jgi:hypoxanthine phosphoribosyltransferase
MQPRPLIRAEAIAVRVRELGAELDRAYAGRAPLLLALMDGAFCFAADLSRAMTLPELELAFLRVRSYRGTAWSGAVEMEGVPDLAGEHVLIVDDILDSGRTLRAVRDAVVAAEAESVAVCVALDKPGRRSAEGLQHADWVGFTIPDAFVVGYGLDLDGRWRHLPDVCVLPEEPAPLTQGPVAKP